ncbi:MAG: hypothetical protein JST00_23525 [Deltaproteobacteria bacterium]|nr:hypothetical protein [Deltaproteobacteria bacterium]
MHSNTVVLALSLLLALCGAAEPPPSTELDPLRAEMRALTPLHERVGAPKSGEWRAVHREPRQTFDRYVADASAILPTRARSTVVVQPLGPLRPSDARIVGTVALALEAYFGLHTRVERPLVVDVPPGARRGSHGFGEQLLTTHLLGELEKRLPDDATAYIAFTASDLWPGDGWNYVFGQGSLRDRVGVWSLARNGDSSDEAGYDRALLRAIKVATHEVGHMFGMHHCTTYRCNMAGANSLEESDQSPVWLCPECLAKLSWATGEPARAHLRRMHAFFTDRELAVEAQHYAASLAVIERLEGARR